MPSLLRRRLLQAPLLYGLLAGCDGRAPLRIGFIGGLSDRVSDVGQAGLEGVTLAVERLNRHGGLRGQMVEIVARDDRNDRQAASDMARELVAARVEAVIGPFSSGIAAAVMPVLEQAAVLTISPTITSMDFVGRDDHLVRINRTTRDNASDYATQLARRGQKRVAVAYDQRNRAFSESWLGEFRTAAAALGTPPVGEVGFESRADADFASIVAAMLDTRPDGLLFIASAADVARLAQQARRLAPALPISASEWAATEQLVVLGGEVIEGLLIAQGFNRDDGSARYREFREAYLQRFTREPGYSAVMAHDAASVLFDALQRRRPGETPRQALLARGPYLGLQQQIVFDAFGDSRREVTFTEIRQRRFQRVK